MTDLLLRIDGKFTALIPLLIKSSLMKCVLVSVLRRSLRTGLNNLYWDTNIKFWDIEGTIIKTSNTVSVPIVG